MGDNRHQAFPVGESLTEAVLARSRQLPRKPAPVALAGQRVRLAPLEIDRDVAALHALTNGSPVTLGERQVGPYDAAALVWRYLGGGPFADAAALAAYLRPQVEAVDGLCLCVFDRATDRPIGVVNLMNNMPQHLKVELGGIWYSPVAQGVGANTEATYLLLGHVFGLGYRRVEWKCDAFHVRSRRAALGLGFTFEGIQEYHFIVKGRTRDTAWFRILDHEWDGVRQRLEARLGRAQ